MTSPQARAPKLSFSRQIILLITAAVISLSVVGSVTAAYFINDRISNIVFDQGRQITGALAHQSVLPLLSGMPDTVEDDVNTTLQYPNIQAISIYDKNGRLLINTGPQSPRNVNTFPNNTAPFEAALLRETDDSWEFIAAVYDIDVKREDEPSLDELFVRTPELIGYVVIQADKSNLYKIQGELLLDNLYIFLGIGVLMLAISILVSQQMTTPLDHLAKLMRRAEGGEEGIRSSPNGPVEIHNMARAFNTMMDALEQRQAHIRSLLLQHETVVSNVPGIIVEIDCDNRLVWWNKYTESVTGQDNHLLKKMNFKQLLPDEQRREVIDGLTAIRSKRRGELHADIMTAAGPVPYQLNASEIQDMDGNNTNLLIVGLDDSQSILAQKALKKARDAALESARIKSEFLANMSHEIRTPMNGMFGMLQLLSDSDMGKEEKGYVDIALRSAEQLLNIINDILDFSKAEAGKLKLEHVEFSPRALIGDIVDLFMPTCQHKNINMFSKIDANVPPLILGDPTKFSQLISNLVGNAVKFTDEGHICVSCRLLEEASALANKKLIVDVEDTGIGIEHDAQEKIFDSFIQADGSSTRRYSGTGLGLAIVRQLVDLMGGSIELSSSLGKGSTFRITLPVRVAARHPAAEFASANGQIKSITKPNKKRTQDERINILVVEDNKTNQRVITTMLGKLGYQPDIVNNGEEALSLIAASGYELIFMDCQMPVMDGYQTTKIIREMEANSKAGDRTRIVAMTGNALEGDRERCIDAGMDDYMAKPVRLALLKKVLGKWGDPALDPTLDLPSD